MARHLSDPEGIRSFLQVPIRVDGEVFGVFGANYCRLHAFTADEQRVLLALWLYATTGRRLVRPELDPRVVRHLAWRAASGPLVFFTSLASAPFNPLAAELSWLLIAVLMLTLRPLFGDAALSGPGPAEPSTNGDARTGRARLRQSRAC